MKILGKRALYGVVATAMLAGFAMGGDFKSAIITSSSLVVNVADEHFLRIWNFTQEGGTQRGVVAVTTNDGTANVLTATIIDSSASSSSSTLEPIDRVVIAGPAQVTVAPVTGATLFITYRRQLDEEAGARATPAPSATPTPTPTPTVTPTPTP
jgi:hypothetical protein